MAKKHVRVVALLVMIVALIFMQPNPVRAQQQENYSQVSKTAGATAAMYGAGAGICTLLTAGGCGVGLLIGGVVLGTVAAAVNYFPTPEPELPLGPYGMPDYFDYSVSSSGGGSTACGEFDIEFNPFCAW